MLEQLSTSVGLPDFSFVAGQGDKLECLNTTVREIARTTIPVLLLGESGTGKDVYARLLHQLSDRSGLEFKKLNCSILNPEEILGIVRHHPPTDSNTCSVGTLFLDGVEELQPACQRALLSVLPENQSHVGNAGIDSFPRLVSSSSQDLDELVERGAFRKELFFRIDGLCLRLPPLRERKADIRAFLEYFIRKHAQELKREIPALDSGMMDHLMAHDWPGNIRQLENVSRQIVALGNANSILDSLRTSSQLASTYLAAKINAPLKLAAKAASRQAERELILRALERTHWNRKQAARDLQISYKSLLYKIKHIEASRGKYEG